jgi:nucleoside-diphosphate-sugar epimerase
MKKILITGSEGLIGKNIKSELFKYGYELLSYDLKSGNDICDTKKLESYISQCHGIIHLAAVSRVVWGENDPDLCWKTNAVASKNLIDMALLQKHKPWVLVASSREVYGEPQHLPVSDTDPVDPINIYGRSKVAMEEAALNARELGLTIGIARLANVYGSIDDHHDRVLPAFCKAAVLGKPLRIDGFKNTFDFTHISDTISGLIKMVKKLDAGISNLPPIHLLPGVPTTLEEAALMAIKSANSNSIILEAPSRSYDVSRFYGEAKNALLYLNWQAKILPKQGIEMLVNEFKKEIIGEIV